MDKRLLIGIGILILVGLGFLFVTTITGDVTGDSDDVRVVENEYFRISEFGNKDVASPIRDDPAGPEVEIINNLEVK